MRGEIIVNAVIRLLREKGVTFDAWTDCQIVSYVSWFMERNHCSIIMDGNECAGVGLIRYVNDPSEAESPLAHRPDGKMVWVDVVVASCPLVFSVMLHQLSMVMERDGNKANVIAGRRVRRGGRLFMIELSKFLRFNDVQTERA